MALGVQSPSASHRRGEGRHQLWGIRLPQRKSNPSLRHRGGTAVLVQTDALTVVLQLEMVSRVHEELGGLDILSTMRALRVIRCSSA